MSVGHPQLRFVRQGSAPRPYWQRDHAVRDRHHGALDRLDGDRGDGDRTGCHRRGADHTDPRHSDDADGVILAWRRHPVQNGTVVTFTTTIGRIEPAEARTNNGQVRVKYFADGQSGTATITAFSGGASGKLENLKVGSAGADHVLLTANPQALACFRRHLQIAARVEDVSGVGLPAVQVTFTTTRGQLNPSTATTDAAGTATATLSTSQEAVVTANAAGKTATATVTISPRTGISVTPPSGLVSAGVPTSFTVTVASTANISNVVLNLGDGTIAEPRADQRIDDRSSYL